MLYDKMSKCTALCEQKPIQNMTLSVLYTKPTPLNTCVVLILTKFWLLIVVIFCNFSLRNIIFLEGNAQQWQKFAQKVTNYILIKSGSL